MGNRAGLKQRSGIILVSVLWMLLIMSIMTFSLARSLSVDHIFARYELGKLRSEMTAVSGFMLVKALVRADSKSVTTRDYDALGQCGWPYEKGADAVTMFKNIAVGDQGRLAIASSHRNFKDDAVTDYSSPGDEDGKLNLNALSAENYTMLRELIALAGFSREKGTEIAAAVVDWHDEDDQISVPPDGAEDHYYSELKPPYHCKNAPFEQLEELRMVRGMNTEIYDAIKDYVTVYPKDSQKMVLNFNTSPGLVLQALGRMVVPMIPDAKEEDADRVAQAMDRFRRGVDLKSATEDDRIFAMENINFERDFGFSSAAEISLYTQMMTNYYSKSSRFIRARIEGRTVVGRARTELNVIIDRTTMAAVYWHKN